MRAPTNNSAVQLIFKADLSCSPPTPFLPPEALEAKQWTESAIQLGLSSSLKPRKAPLKKRRGGGLDCVRVCVCVVMMKVLGVMIEGV